MNSFATDGADRRAPVPGGSSPFVGADTDPSAFREHCVLMLSETAQRLHHAVDESLDPATGIERTREVVLECVATLARLRASLLDDADLAEAGPRIAEDVQFQAVVRPPEPERRSRARGAPNNTPFLEDAGALEGRLHLAVAHTASTGGSLSYMQLHLQGLDQIVVTYGQETADTVKRIVTQRLGRSVRVADIAGVRRGGRVGIAFAGLPDRATTSLLAAKLLDAVTPAMKVGVLTLRVLPSIGIASYPEDGATADELMQRADSAMGWAIEQGCGYAYSDELESGAGSAHHAPANSNQRFTSDKFGRAESRDWMSAFEAEVRDFAAAPGGADAMLAAFWDTGGIARGDDLARLLEERDRGESKRLPAMIASGHVFGFEWHREFWVPMFQFDLQNLTLKAGPGVVLAELSPVFNGWELASWFAEPNSSLHGSRPVDMLDSDLAAVLEAARVDRFVAAG